MGARVLFCQCARIAIGVSRETSVWPPEEGAKGWKRREVTGQSLCGHSGTRRMGVLRMLGLLGSGNVAHGAVGGFPQDVCTCLRLDCTGPALVGVSSDESRERFPSVRGAKAFADQSFRNETSSTLGSSCDELDLHVLLARVINTLRITEVSRGALRSGDGSVLWDGAVWKGVSAIGYVQQ